MAVLRESSWYLEIEEKGELKGELLVVVRH
jgi:hypothetical protein